MVSPVVALAVSAVTAAPAGTAVMARALTMMRAPPTARSPVERLHLHVSGLVRVPEVHFTL